MKAKIVIMKYDKKGNYPVLIVNKHKIAIEWLDKKPNRYDYYLELGIEEKTGDTQ